MVCCDKKAVVDRIGSRPPNSDHDLFLCKFGSGECFETSMSSYWAGCRQLSCKIYFLSLITIWSRNDSLLHRMREDDSRQWFFFSLFVQFTRHPLIELFHLSNFLQMPDDPRMADIEFFGNLSCSCKRISFNDCSQLVLVNFQWPANTFFIFKALVPFAKLLEAPLHCSLAAPGPNALLMLPVVSAALQPILNLNNKNLLHLLFF